MVEVDRLELLANELRAERDQIENQILELTRDLRKKQQRVDAAIWHLVGKPDDEPQLRENVPQPEVHLPEHDGATGFIKEQVRVEAEASTRLDREGDGQTIAIEPMPKLGADDLAEVDEAVSKDDSPVTADEVLKALRDYEEPLRIGALLVLLGDNAKRGTVKDQLTILVESGEVEQVGNNNANIRYHYIRTTPERRKMLKQVRGSGVGIGTTTTPSKRRVATESNEEQPYAEQVRDVLVPAFKHGDWFMFGEAKGLIEAAFPGVNQFKVKDRMVQLRDQGILEQNGITGRGSRWRYVAPDASKSPTSRPRGNPRIVGVGADAPVRGIPVAHTRARGASGKPGRDKRRAARGVKVKGKRGVRKQK